MDDRRGYTMVELVMVLGIIAVSMLIMGPRLSGVLNAWEMDTEINKMMSKIRQVQQLAIAEETTYRINWDVSPQYYVINRFDGLFWQGYEAPYYGNDVEVISTTIPVEGVIEFDSFGAPSECGMIHFTHTVTGENKYLYVRCVTGHLEVM